MRINKLLKIAAYALALFAPAAGAQTILCESDSQRTRYCDADTRDGVRLVEQHSRGACIEGRSWGYDRRGIWVSGGCRAEFELGGDRHAYRDDRRRDHDDRYDDRDHDDRGRGSQYVDRVRCESQDQGTQRCEIPGGRGGARVEIAEQLSRAPCRFGTSWGYDRRAIWVSDGCRAEFLVRR